MNTIQDVIEKLELNTRVSVVQFNQEECAQMARIIRRELTPTLMEALAVTVGAVAGEVGKAFQVANAVDLNATGGGDP